MQRGEASSDAPIRRGFPATCLWRVGCEELAEVGCTVAAWVQSVERCQSER